MNNVEQHIIKWLLPVVLSWTVFASCSNNAPDGDLDGVSSEQPVSMRIVVGGETASRSIPVTDEEETGSIYENHIDIEHGDYRILFFDDNNKFISKFESGDITLIPAVSDERIYNVLGALTSPLPSTFKVVVLANWGPDNYPEMTPGATTIDDVCSQIYNYTWGFEPSADSGGGIPMYGIKTCSDNVPFSPDVFYDLGTIDMLRAMAKVEIICEDENGMITSATFNCVNPSGYCAPLEMYGFTENVSSVCIPENINAEVRTAEYKSGEHKVVFYIPEYRNSANRATIGLQFKFSGDETKEGTIYFQDYGNGTPFDIARNYVYRFIIVRLTTDLQVDYTICPWNEYTVEIPPFD